MRPGPDPVLTGSCAPRCPAAGYELYDLNLDPYEINNYFRTAPKASAHSARSWLFAASIHPVEGSCGQRMPPPAHSCARLRTSGRPHLPRFPCHALAANPGASPHLPTYIPLRQGLVDFLKATIDAMKSCKGRDCSLEDVAALARAQQVGRGASPLPSV